MRNLLLSDAHTHMGTEKELQERRENGIFSLLCATTPPEAEMLLRKIGWMDHLSSDDSVSGFSCSDQTLIPTCGLHPWHADRHTVSDMKPYLEAVPVIGEIGMDSVWCSVPPELQKTVFCQQLDLACEMKKPVILHTKGQEKEIAAIIRNYPSRYLVHWYSCENHLEEYLALDCYFSIGPDVWWNPAVQQAAKKVPLNRLLVETDGFSAVKWAWDEAPVQEKPEPARTISDSLQNTIITVAKLRNLPPETIAQITRDNLIFGFAFPGCTPASTHLSRT